MVLTTPELSKCCNMYSQRLVGTNVILVSNEFYVPTSVVGRRQCWNTDCQCNKLNPSSGETPQVQRRLPLYHTTNNFTMLLTHHCSQYVLVCFNIMVQHYAPCIKFHNRVDIICPISICVIYSLETKKKFN